MSFDQIPTVFVDLKVAPGQFDLFQEIEAEVCDAITQHQAGHISVYALLEENTLLIDGDTLRFALGWTHQPGGDIVTLAIGAKPGAALINSQAIAATDLLRDLVGRTEALFDANLPLWQFTALPLSVETIVTHAQHLGVHETAGRRDGDVSFFRFNPDPQRNVLPAPSITTFHDIGANLKHLFEKAYARRRWAIQVSAFALSSAFALVTPPVGIVLFAYAALRQGADMGLLPPRLWLG